MAVVLLVSMLLAGQVVQATGSQPIYGVSIYDGSPYLVEVYAEVVPGNGDLRVNGVSGDELFKHSLMEACYMAAWLHGLDPWSLEYRITIVVDGLDNTYLSGSSLSLTVYLAVSSALSNVFYYNDFISTGMVNPDGTIGFVGYVEVKGELADRLGVPYYLYPALQENRYNLTTGDFKMGVYTSTGTAIIVEENILENITAGKKPVSSVVDAENFALNIRYSREKTFETESRIRSEYTLKILELLYNRTLTYLEYATTLYENARESSISAQIENMGEAIESVREVTARIGEPDDVWDWKLVLELLDGYTVVSQVYYTSLLTYNFSDLIAEYKLAEHLAEGMIRGMEAGLPAEGVPYAAEAAYSYLSAQSLYNQSMLLAMTYTTGIGGGETLAAVARGLAEAVTLMYRAAILASEAQALDGPLITREMLGKTVSLFTEYTIHLREYATVYASSSHVSSDMIFLANGYLWRVLSEENLFMNIIVELAHLSNLIRAIALYSTYMGLHPGFPGVAELRYDAINRILSRMYRLYGKPGVFSYYDSLVEHENIEDKFYLAEIRMAVMKVIATSYSLASPRALEEFDSRRGIEGHSYHYNIDDTATRPGQSWTLRDDIVLVGGSIIISLTLVSSILWMVKKRKEKVVLPGSVR